MDEPHGPYVQTAALVEKVLDERDGVLSLIRVIDRFTFHAKASGPEAVLPDELPEGSLTVTLVVTLKAGDARGRHQVKIRPHLPSGQTLDEHSIDVHFEGEDRGVNLILSLSLPTMEGLFWIDVGLGDRVLTRVPLRVTYQRDPN